MGGVCRKFFLIIGIISFVYVNSYAENNYYQQPNYDDPTKSNYMAGTRTDMAPKVDVPETDEKTQNKSLMKRGTEKYMKYIGSTFRKSPGQRAKDIGKSAATGAVVGAVTGGGAGAAVGAIGGVIQGAGEELTDNVRWTLKDNQQK